MENKNVLIFGISGQDGFYLNQLCINQGYEVIGVSRSSGPWIKGDVSDFNFINTLVKDHTPALIFHLAANSTTKHEALFENHETISTGTLNILESVYRYSAHSKVFLSGSGLQFVNKGQPISENDPFEASNPYAVARIQSVYAARYYRKLGVQVYVGYFFHHDSFRRPERHLNMKIAQAALRVKNGSNEIVEIGNIDVVKEYNYAGDMVEAIWLLMNQTSYFEAVIGCGKGYAIKEWIRVCFESLGMDWQPYININEKFKPEFMSLTSNSERMFSIGWKPAVGINELADKMINRII